jgi:hypothetical protein
MPPETGKGSGETIGLIGNRRRGLLIDGSLDMKINARLALPPLGSDEQYAAHSRRLAAGGQPGRKGLEIETEY